MANHVHSIAFGQAICDHFGLSRDVVLAYPQVNSADGEILSVTLSIMITPDDLIAIGDRLKGTFDFNKYMRKRTDDAHAAYMAQHMCGGKAYL
jgi:hypothetical protein